MLPDLVLLQAGLSLACVSLWRPQLNVGTLRRPGMVTHSSPPDSLWVLRATAPWGDYGRVLVHGMSARLRRIDGRIQLERTAPFVPPLSLPGVGDVVVTADLRAQLEREGISGMVFRPLDKARVVHLEWTHWDRSAGAPALYAKSGEPEDYILAHPHDQIAADSLGELWELVPSVGGQLARQTLSRSPRLHRFTLQDGTQPSADIFRAQNMRHVLVTERLQRLLNTVDNSSLEFQPVLIGDVPKPEPPERRYLGPDEPVPDGYSVTECKVSPFNGEVLRVAVRSDRASNGT
jgi:hypothetical protein